MFLNFVRALGQGTVQRVKRIDVFMNDMYDDCWVHKLSIHEMVEKYGYMNIIFASIALLLLTQHALK